MSSAEKHTFQAEIKQLLNILVHSLYTDREIFLRELISNASDALNKAQFEMLTNREIRDPDTELAIYLYPDPEKRQLRIVDTGIGMTAEEMIDNLGVIARSGAREFLQRVQDKNSPVTTDLIGQFGVGFYSVFMVAEKVEVTSRSYLPEAQAATWASYGDDSYEILAADKSERGTEIRVYLREDAADFANAWHLREIIKRHSDYVAFPIYLIEPPKPQTEAAETESEPETPPAAPAAPQPVNQRTAIWRRPASEVSDEDYHDFYRMLTLDFEAPALRIHSQGDAPIQYYALLYIPAKGERNMFSLRKEPGLKLYARKVLIQEYTTDLLPEYLQFVQGVVDSEDIPLNVSRETVQSNPQMAKLKQTLTRRILGDLGKLAQNDAEKYGKIWAEFSAYLKHGVISEFSDRERLLPLLRFYTSRSDSTWVSLEKYVEEMVQGQDKIYYMITDNVASGSRSPHLDPFRARGIEVLYLTETVDGFLVSSLREYKQHQLVSVDAANLDLEGVGQAPAAESDQAPINEADIQTLSTYFKEILGDQVESVRVSKVLAQGSPARLVAPEGALDRHTQRIYRMLEKDFQTPPRILEINPHHPIIHNLTERLHRGLKDDFLAQSVQALYESALLADGIHPNPADMVKYMQTLMEAATRLS